MRAATDSIQTSGKRLGGMSLIRQPSASLPPTSALFPRVLVTTPDLSIHGGVSAYYRALRPHLPNTVVYFTIGRRPSERSVAMAALRLLKDYVLFAYELARRPYDIAHVNPSVDKSLIRDAGFCLLAKLFRKSVVVFIHGWDIRYDFLLRRWLRPVYKYADVFIVLAEEYREKLKALGYGDANLETTAVGDDVFEELPRRRANHNEPFNLLFLARVEKEKGLYKTIEAYAHAKMRHPTLRLTIAGDGGHLNAVKDYVARTRLSDVTFSGFVTGAAKGDTFRGADCYILLSDFEGLPVSVLEAMAYGLPVITHLVGGIKDFFQSPEMGYAIQPNDSQGAARAIERLVESPQLRESIGMFNREFASGRFAASVVAARLRAKYWTRTGTATSTGH